MPLTPKDGELLLLLLRRGDSVVGKTEIMNSVWGQTHVTENSLTQSIFRLRQALGDNPSAPQFIETVPKRGYRFIGPVDVSPEKVEPNPIFLDALPPVILKHSRKKNLKLASAFFLIIVGVSVAALSLRGHSLKKPSPLPTPVKVTPLTSGGTWSPGISPDGKLVVYTAYDANMHESVWIRETVNGNSTQLIPADGTGYCNYVFSHDGSYLYYSRLDLHSESMYFLGDTYRIPVIGGASYRVASNVSGTLVPSPDDRQVAFLRVDPSVEEYKLIIANADGSGEHVVSSQKWPAMSWFPGWSPDGKRLVYCARVYGPQGFYNTVMSVPVEGGPEHPLTSSKWMDVGCAVWLPDGSAVLVTGREHPGDQFQIYLISYPSGDVRRITNDTNSYSDLGVTADSKKVIAEVDDLISNIWIVSKDDPRKAQQITYSGKDGLGGISWTPDGRVVYATISRDTYNETGATGDKAIWIMDADGQNRRQLTFDEGINSDPAVSPDGRYIVFSAYRGGGWGIWRMNIDGTEPRPLASGGTLTNPVCSPDAQWVFFKRLGSSSKPSICRVSINGGEVVEISDKNAFAPAVSPDGKFVAFFSTEGNRNILQVIPSTGGETLKTFNIAPDNEYLLFANITPWSRDGKLLTYTDTDRHVSNIYGIPVNGGPISQLTHFNADLIFTFAWSLDGSRLALARGQFSKKIVLLTDFTNRTTSAQ